jgi:hypothetical protein
LGEFENPLGTKIDSFKCLEIRPHFMIQHPASVMP